MVQLREEPALVFHTGMPVRILEGRADDLDRKHPIHGCVTARQIDHAHPPSAKTFDDLVSSDAIWELGDRLLWASRTAAQRLVEENGAGSVASQQLLDGPTQFAVAAALTLDKNSALACREPYCVTEQFCEEAFL